MWSRYAKIIVSPSLSFSGSQKTYIATSVSLPSSEYFLFRAAPYNHRSAARGAFLRPWEDLRRIWVRFAGGLALIMSATSHRLVFLKDRLRIFPRTKKRSGRSANNEGCSQVIQLSHRTNSNFLISLFVSRDTRL